MRIVVVGAGVAGLGAAFSLAGDGHDVVLLAFYDGRESRPPEEPLGPPREEFLEAIG